MSDITGPISSLPGHIHSLPEGTMCDEHPDRPAIRRIQGETDSFGSELNDYCQECVDEIKQQVSEEEESYPCDWCKKYSAKRRPFRDSDEGMCGPVYDVCPECIRKYNDRIRQEMENDDYYR